MNRKLKLEYVSVDDLLLWQENPRKNEDAAERLVGLIESFGFINPIIATPDKMIRAGHTRIKAAKKKGLEEVPVIFVEFESEAQAQAYSIADNKASEWSEWDGDMLTAVLMRIENERGTLEETGLSDSEIEELVQKEVIGNTDPDAIPEIKENELGVKTGDLWILGEHRLLCGDCTVKENVERLMQGEKADMAFTSPPYNLGNNAKLRGYNGDGDDSAYLTKSDHKTSEEYLEFLKKFTTICIENTLLTAVNIQLLAGNKFVISEYWNHFKNHLIDLMIWDKEHAAPQMAARVLNSVFEFVFLFSNELNPSRAIKTGIDFRGTESNIFRLNPVGKKDPLAKDHGAVFPVAFAEHFVTKFGGKLIFEPFCGSGSTLIACEKTNRKCFGMEIDPHYCSVIIKRWEEFTGKKATLVG